MYEHSQELKDTSKGIASELESEEKNAETIATEKQTSTMLTEASIAGDDDKDKAKNRLDNLQGTSDELRDDLSESADRLHETEDLDETRTEIAVSSSQT